MDLRVETHIGAVERTVTLLEREGKPASAVTLARSFAAPVADVWDAVTTAEHIPRWFLPITGDLRLGGRYQLEGNAGGEITECERLSHVAVTWVFMGDVSWVEARLSNEGAGGVRVSLTHTALLSPHWDTFGPGAAGVAWEMGFLGLALYLAAPDEPKIDEEAFAVSPEGRAFITASSEAWGQAAVAAGTDPEAAAASARRTTAFYTGEEVEPA